MYASIYPSRIENHGDLPAMPTGYLAAEWGREAEDRWLGEAPAPWEDRVDFLARTDPLLLEGDRPRPLAAVFAALTKWLFARDTSPKSPPEAGHVARRIHAIRTLHAG